MITFKDFNTVKRSPLDYALLFLIVLVIIFGLSKQLGHAGMLAGFAALLTYIVETPGSLRQRAGGMMVFWAFGFIQILLVAWIGNTGLPVLILLFAVSFVCSWMMGYGTRAAVAGLISNVWITIMPPMGVANDLVLSLIGFSAGSFLVIVASIIPPLLRGTDQTTNGQDDAPVFEPVAFNTSTLFAYSLIRAGAITLGGFIGQQYLVINELWIAMTVNLIMPPALKTTWLRGFYRALGTVLGALLGFLLVWLVGDNTTVLLIIEFIAVFLFVFFAKGYVYAVLVFFSSIFVVTQLGLEGLEMANFGGGERIIATVVGIIIAFVTIFILQLIVKRDTHSELGTTA